MKILITGGAGFIGSHIVDACVQRGYEVSIIDNLSTGQRQNIAQHEANTSVRFFEADICDENRMKEIFQMTQPNVVFHLAAQINVRESIKNPSYDIKVNIGGTLSVLEAMRSVGCQRMIFSSTGGAMFGGDKPPYSESMEAHPETPYGISKRSIELLLEFYERQHGIESAILRYANVYGPRQNAHGEAGVVSIFLNKIHSHTPPKIFGDGTQTRDFVHVSDVVAANMHAFDKHLTGIYHVGTGVETSVNTLWQLLANATQTSLAPEYTSALGEIQRTALDCTKLVSTGWSPQYDMQNGITSLLHVS